MTKYNHLSFYFYYCGETLWPEASWEWKGLFDLHFTTAVDHWRKLGQELKQGRSWCRGHRGGVLHTVSLPLNCLAGFLTHPGPPVQGSTSYDGPGPLSLPSRPVYSLMFLAHFLSWGSPLSSNSNLCQGDIKPAIRIDKIKTSYLKWTGQTNRKKGAQESDTYSFVQSGITRTH